MSLAPSWGCLAESEKQPCPGVPARPLASRAGRAGHRRKEPFCFGFEFGFSSFRQVISMKNDWKRIFAFDK
jgi:hypothetical protein